MKIFRKTIALLITMALVLPMASFNVSAAVFGPLASLPFVEEFDGFTVADNGTMAFDNLVNRTDLDATVDKMHTLGDIMFDNYLGTVAKPGWDENYGGTVIFDGTPSQSWSMSVNVPLEEAYRVSASIKKSGTVVRTCVSLRNADALNRCVVFENNRNILVGGTDTGLDWQDDVWYNVDYVISNKYKKIVAFITDTSTGETSRFEANDYFTILDGYTKITIGANATNQAGGIVEVGYFKVDKADESAFDVNVPVVMEYDENYIYEGFNDGTWTLDCPADWTYKNIGYVNYLDPFPTTGITTLEIETSGGGKRQISLSNYDGTGTPATYNFMMFNCGSNATAAGAILVTNRAVEANKPVGEDADGNAIYQRIYGYTNVDWADTGTKWMETTETKRYRVVAQFLFDEAKDYYQETSEVLACGYKKWAPVGTKKVCPVRLTFYENDNRIGTETLINYVLDMSMLNGLMVMATDSAYKNSNRQVTLTKISYTSESSNWEKVSMEAPFNGETNVQLDSEIAVIVDDLATDDLTVEVAGVAGEMTVVESETAGNKITFNPENDLAPDTTYTVNVKKADKIVYTGTFKTMAQDDIRNSVIIAPNADKTTYTLRKMFKLTKADATAYQIVVSYGNDGKIADCKITPYKGETVYGDLTAEVEDGKTIKAFLWENLDSIKPLAVFEDVK